MKVSATAITGSLQLATYAAIIAYASCANLIIGHWPSYGNPDPKTLPINFLLPLILLLIFASLASVIAYPIAAAFSRQNKIHRRWHFYAFLSGFILWTLDMVYFHFMSPSHDGLLSWIFD